MEGLKTKEDRRFQTFWVIFFILISVIAIIPVLRVISISFSGRDAINKGCLLYTSPSPRDTR